MVLTLILAGCSSSTLKQPDYRDPPSFGPAQRSDLPAISLISERQSAEVTLMAMSLIGTPYRYGGNTPEAGFDCSGLIAYVYKTQARVTSPRTTAKLMQWGVQIAPSQLRSGDIVLFGKRDTPTHAGIYVGENRFVHAPSTGGAVHLSHLQTRYWAQLNPRFRRPSTK